LKNVLLSFCLLLFLIGCDNSEKTTQMIEFNNKNCNKTIKMKTIPAVLSPIKQITGNRDTDAKVNEFIKDKNVIKIISENADNMNHSYVIFYTEKGD
jgi:hypothetical protein